MSSPDPVAVKLRLLGEVLSLTQEMHRLSQEGVSDALLALLTRRGELMNEIESCDARIDWANLEEETREAMLTLLRQITVLNEELSARLFALIAEEQEVLSRMRHGRAFLHSLRENLPPSPGELNREG